MKKIPLAAISAVCITLSFLIAARCAVTAGRVVYYGGTDWVSPVVEDPWFTVGIISAVASLICLILLIIRNRKQA